MTIEGLGKKFQEARLARGLTLDEAARMTKIRPSRLAEIEADDFSQFPSLAYAKGFLLIYGKFLDVDVTPYMEAFETSSGVTVDGYSYLQEEPAPAPARTPIVRRRPARVSSPSSSSGERTSLMPLVLGVVVIVIGFLVMKLFLNLQRLAPRTPEPKPVAQASPVAPAATPASVIAPPTQATAKANVATPAPTVVAANVTTPAPPPPTAAPTLPPVAIATPSPARPAPAASEPEVRRAEPVRPEDLKKAAATVEATGPNRVAIKPVRKTYIKVVVDDESVRPAFERWISPADGTVEFRGEKIAVRVLDRDAVQIKKNGKTVEDDDADVTVE
jgi:cytoskeletal protein RodZ